MWCGNPGEWRNLGAEKSLAMLVRCGEGGGGIEGRDWPGVSLDVMLAGVAGVVCVRYTTLPGRKT